MTKRAIIAAILLMATPAFAGVGVPTGWYIAGTRADHYVFGTEQVDGATGQQSAFIQAKPSSGDSGGVGDYGTLMQTIKADDYIGQRVRLSIRLKGESALAVRMFFRVDRSDGKFSQFANTQQNPLVGTAGWKQYDLVLDVPPDSATLNYGFSLAGYTGKGWADGVSLTQVGKDVPVSTVPISRKPVNMGFDQ